MVSVELNRVSFFYLQTMSYHKNIIDFIRHSHENGYLDYDVLANTEYLSRGCLFVEDSLTMYIGENDDRSSKDMRRALKEFVELIDEIINSCAVKPAKR